MWISSLVRCTTLRSCIRVAGWSTYDSLAAVTGWRKLQGRRRNSDALSFSDTLVFSERLVNQARFQYSRLAPAFEASGGNSPVVLIALNDPLPADDPERRTGTLVAGSSSSGGSDRSEQRIQIQNVLSFVDGDHSLKLGADIHHVSSTFIDCRILVALSTLRAPVISSRACQVDFGRRFRARQHRRTSTPASFYSMSGRFCRNCY